MAFLGRLVLLEEAPGKMPLGLMVASIDTDPRCELDICQILVANKHGLPCLYPLHQTFPGDFSSHTQPTGSYQHCKEHHWEIS